MSLPHETRSIQVWVDADIGVADMVVYLNTISGVRTLASCQGTIGEGGPAPFRAQVMATWTPEAFECLSAEFDISYPEECDGTWGYIHPREGWKAVASRPVPPADTPATRCYVCDGLPCRCDLPDSPVIPDSSPERVALRIAKNMLVALRREACNDEMPELSEELTSIIQVVDAAVPEWIKVDADTWYALKPAFTPGDFGTQTVNEAGLPAAIRTCMALSPTCEVSVIEVSSVDITWKMAQGAVVDDEAG